MRKFAKGPAITAAVLSIFLLLSLLINLVNYLSIPGIKPLDYLTLALSFLATILLVIALFRGKADAFGAVACFAHVPVALMALVSSIISCAVPVRYLGLSRAATVEFIGYTAQALANLLKLAAFLMMAIQCLRKKVRKSTACILLPIVSAVFLLVSIVLTLYVTYGRMGIRLDRFSSLPVTVIATVIGTLVGSIIGVLPQIITGLAFGKLRAEDPAAVQAPLYQQYQLPQYQQPQYQAPQYQQPQYQQPQYQQPQYQAPQYQAPQYQAPQYQAPQYQAPQYQAPQYQAPQHQAPQYQAPQYQEQPTVIDHNYQ